MDKKTKIAALATAGGLVTISGCILKKAFPKTGCFVTGYGLAHMAIAGIVLADDEFCLSDMMEKELTCVTKAIRD